MKPVNAIISAILIICYILLPGIGTAFANQILHDRGLAAVECPCCNETDENTAHETFPGTEGDNEIIDHACNCSCHLPSWQSLSEPPIEPVRLMPGDKPQAIPEVYIPIFVPPQNRI